MSEFEGFGKIPRLFRGCVITEKLDGTNAQVNIVDSRALAEEPPAPIARVGDLLIYAGSRNQYIYPSADNYGFAQWVLDNSADLANLGVGRHFGEWWGSGIQRGYGLNEKRFSLFNVGKWTEETKPKCCHVVPILTQGGNFNTEAVRNIVQFLKETGSKAAPGYMNPEGIIVYHTAGNNLFKVTCENDETPKGKSE